MQYRVGSVVVENGNPEVIFVGASEGADLIAIGDAFKTDRDGDGVYQIASRTPSSGPSLTSITLTSPYGGADGSGLFYQIVNDFTPNRGYARLKQGDADSADWMTENFDKIDEDIGSIFGTGEINFENGGILFKTAEGLATDVAHLKWDSVNNRLGLGHQNPSYKLHLYWETEEEDGIYATAATPGATTTIGMYDGVTFTVLRSTDGQPSLQTDALTFVFYDSGSNRMRLDQGRLVLGAGSAGGASAGDLVLANQRAICGLQVDGSTARPLINMDTSDRVVLAEQGNAIKIGTPAVALGGMAVATLGTVGGSGPSSSAQQFWIPFISSTGDQCFLAAWK